MKVGEIAALSPVGSGENSRPDPGAARQEAIDRRALRAAVRELDLPELSLPNRALAITFDREAKQSIVQIVDRDSGEVVQQIPGKDVLERARYYRQILNSD